MHQSPNVKRLQSVAIFRSSRLRHICLKSRQITMVFSCCWYEFFYITFTGLFNFAIISQHRNTNKNAVCIKRRSATKNADKKYVLVLQITRDV